MERPKRFRYPPVRRHQGEDWPTFYARRSAVHDAARQRYNVEYGKWRAWYNDPANAAERDRAYREQREREQAEAKARAEASALHIRDTFDSWLDFVERAEGPSDMTYDRVSRDAGSWGDLVSWPEACRLARDGWPEGAERLADMTARLEGRIANRAAIQIPGYAVVGPGVLDMGRYLMGHPEQFMVWQDSDETAETSNATPRVLKLLISGTSSRHVSAEAMYWRGAAAVAIIDMAERAGARVEAELVMRVANHTYIRREKANSDIETRIMLKRAQDHVPTELLAYALANQATLRRLTFSQWETLDAKTRRALDIGGHYGYPSDVTEEEREGAIYLPVQLGGAGPFYSPESTAKWVIETLAAQGIEVETT